MLQRNFNEKYELNFTKSTQGMAKYFQLFRGIPTEYILYIKAKIYTMLQTE